MSHATDKKYHYVVVAKRSGLFAYTLLFTTEGKPAIFDDAGKAEQFAHMVGGVETKVIPFEVQ